MEIGLEILKIVIYTGGAIDLAKALECAICERFTRSVVFAVSGCALWWVADHLSAWVPV